MKTKVENVETLAQLMKEYDDIHELIDSFNDALGGLNAGNKCSVTVGSTTVDLKEFEEDEVRVFLVSLLNKAIVTREDFDEKIVKLTELLK